MISEGIFVVDQEFKLLLINSACRELLGLGSRTEITFFDLVHAFNRHYPIEEVISQVFKSKGSHKVSEVKIDEKFFEISAFFVEGVAAVLIYDKTGEQNLMQRHEEFTAMIVHDLRSPLTVVKGMAELLVAEHENLSPVKQAELLVQIKNSSEELLGIVNSLLEDTKADLQKFDVTKKAGDINALLERESGNYRGMIEEKGLGLVLALDKKIPSIEFDDMKISQTLGNLLSNALKFTKSGSVTVRSAFVNGMVKVSVEDTGDGISDSQKEQLFKKFSQLENSKHISAEGTGLGLSIVKGVVEAHGGEIWIEDNKPHGAVFVFTLPV